MTTLGDVINAAVSHAMATGLFTKVNGHEPKSPPAGGPTCSVWVQRLRPAMRSSGSSSTSVVLDLNVRIALPMLKEPQDGIDPAITNAVDVLCRAYVADFTFGGVARAVDVRSMEGTPLSADAGYVELGGQLFRVMTITVPVIVNDLWPESP